MVLSPVSKRTLRRGKPHCSFLLIIMFFFFLLLLLLLLLLPFKTASDLFSHAAQNLAFQPEATFATRVSPSGRKLARCFSQMPDQDVQMEEVSCLEGLLGSKTCVKERSLQNEFQDLCQQYVGLSPFPVKVTTRIVA